MNEEPNSVVIRLIGDSATKSVSLPVVVDLARTGEVVGIEVLNLFSYVESGALDRLSESSSGNWTPISYSYDAACDGFYLRLRKADAPAQKSVRGVLGLDKKGRIVEMRASWA